MNPDVAWLRQVPRQQRSIDRVEALLDTAEEVFGEVGYDRATTNLIAERSGVPVGTLYRWFPDKTALADGLAARYLLRLSETYERLVTDAPPETALIRYGVRELCLVLAKSPAMATLVRTATESANSSVLRDSLETAIQTIIRLRVPTVADADVARIGGMLTAISFSVVTEALGRGPDQFDAIVDEFGDLAISWLSARFPTPDDPVWKAESPLVAPLAPSLGELPSPVV